MADYYREDGTEVTEAELDDQYAESLDYMYEETPFNIPASRILRECDPIAYRVGFSDWVSSLEDDGELFEYDPTRGI